MLQHNITDCHDDPNCYAWYDAAHMWDHFLKNKGTSLWIMYCNFFFGCLPGILYFANSIYISSLEGEEMVVSNPDLSGLDVKNLGRWFAYLFLFFPMIVSIFQLILFNRFIGIRLIWTFFIGQVIGLIWFVLAVVPSVSRRLGRTFRGSRLGHVNLIVIAGCLIVSSLVFVVYTRIPVFRSELYYDPSQWSYHRKRALQTKPQQPSHIITTQNNLIV